VDYLDIMFFVIVNEDYMMFQSSAFWVVRRPLPIGFPLSVCIPDFTWGPSLSPGTITQLVIIVEAATVVMVLWPGTS
jgi:hypothetical protein